MARRPKTTQTEDNTLKTRSLRFLDYPLKQTLGQSDTTIKRRKYQSNPTRQVVWQSHMQQQKDIRRPKKKS